MFFPIRFFRALIYRKGLIKPKGAAITLSQIAEVVELVDALVSGTSEGNLVGVRVSPSAPKRRQKPLHENAEAFFIG